MVAATFNVASGFAGFGSDFRLSFTDFSRSLGFQPAGAPDDGLTLTEVWGFAIALDGATGTLGADDFAVEPATIFADGFESGSTSAWQ